MAGAFRLEKLGEGRSAHTQNVSDPVDLQYGTLTGLFALATDGQIIVEPRGVRRGARTAIRRNVCCVLHSDIESILDQNRERLDVVRSTFQSPVWPPSTNTQVPVMKDASSEATKRMAFATSVGVPGRSIIVSLPKVFMYSSCVWPSSSARFS